MADNASPRSTVTLEDILAARQRIEGGLLLTPCPESIPLSELCDAKIFCKLEYLQRTGSFKERGARNALLQLSPDQCRQGVVAASAGNHALGLAYHGKLLGIRVTVVMPIFAPLIKMATCRRLGARVVLHGQSYGDARTHAERLAAEQGLVHVHGFDDPAIIAGQGTLGLEVLEQAPDVDAIVVPIGGAGLLAGVGLAVKGIKPETLIIGVEPQRAAGFSAAMSAGEPRDFDVQPTLADGLAVPRVGTLAFDIARRVVDEVVTVSEEELALAVLRLVELEKSVVEGAAAAALAACMNGRQKKLAGKNVVLLLTGGNIDPMVLSHVIEKGLVADGRLCRFTAIIRDRPGGLAQLTQAIAEAGVSVHEIVHDRAFSGADVVWVHVHCTVETTDREHGQRLFQLLEERGVKVKAAK